MGGLGQRVELPWTYGHVSRDSYGVDVVQCAVATDSRVGRPRVVFLASGGSPRRGAPADSPNPPRSRTPQLSNVQNASTLLTRLWISTKSSGPSPTTWYARWTSPFFAYLVAGTPSTALKLGRAAIPNGAL
jgi:hypothetical protein